MKSRRNLTGGLLVAVAGGVVAAVCLTTPDAATNQQTPLAVIQNAKVTEMPAVAAALVSQSSPQMKAQVAEDVLRAIAALDWPCSVPYVVSEISRQNPAVAFQTVIAAVKVQPADTFPILSTAMAAAPQEIEHILEAFAREFPELAPMAGIRASEEHPEKTADILRALGRALPALNPYLDRAMGHYGPKADFLTVYKAAQSFALAAIRENESSANTQAVGKLLASQMVYPSNPIPNFTNSTEKQVFMNLVGTWQASSAPASIEKTRLYVKPAGVRGQLPGASPLLQPSEASRFFIKAGSKPGGGGGYSSPTG